MDTLMCLVTSTPTAIDVFMAAGLVLEQTAQAETTGTATSTSVNMVTATPTPTIMVITNTPTTANACSQGNLYGASRDGYCVNDGNNGSKIFCDFDRDAGCTNISANGNANASITNSDTCAACTPNGHANATNTCVLVDLILEQFLQPRTPTPTFPPI